MKTDWKRESGKRRASEEWTENGDAARKKRSRRDFICYDDGDDAPSDGDYGR